MTKLKLNIPTSPQLIAPIIIKTKAIVSITFIKLHPPLKIILKVFTIKYIHFSSFYTFKVLLFFPLKENFNNYFNISLLFSHKVAIIETIIEIPIKIGNP